MSREMDAKIAEWMGWRIESAESGRSRMVGPDGTIYASAAASDPYKSIVDKGIIDYIPNFSTSRDAMSKAEDVVRERGLILEYAEELFEIIAIEPNCTMEPIWLAATAPADQRSRTLCRVIDALEK